MKFLDYVAITFLMAAVFIPVAFMSGPVGFYTILYYDGNSNYSFGIVALTLTPALCAMLKTIMVKLKRKRL
jgi:HAE1 family hydrophobic/amphiphilic exporter-1